MSELSLHKSRDIRDSLLGQLRAKKVIGVEGVAVGGGDGELVLVVDVNALYRGGVPELFEGYAVETAKFGEATCEVTR
jgi:hypothetical protein